MARRKKGEPAPVKPGRACPVCAAAVDYDGYCFNCNEYQAPRMGTNTIDHRCTKQENLAGLAACKAAIAGKRGSMAKALREMLADAPF